jgi:AcrR family transcriptional regulator
MSGRGGGLDGGDPASLRGAATLDLVLRTSTELFAERGFAATSMRQLANRADLPLSAFYYYFGRKYDVLRAIMDDAMARLEVAVEATSDGALGPGRQLMAFVSAHVRVHLEIPNAARVTDGEIRALTPGDRAAFAKRRDVYEGRLRAILGHGVERGEFRADLDVAVASMSILTMGTGVVYWWRPDGRLSAEAIARQMGEFALGLVSGLVHRPDDAGSLDPRSRPA